MIDHSFFDDVHDASVDGVVHFSILLKLLYGKLTNDQSSQFAPERLVALKAGADVFESVFQV